MLRATKIVHYVYQYRGTRSMAQNRIAELAVSQCKTGTFGGVNCESLPKSYTDSGGGCSESFSAHRADYSVDVFAIHQAEAELVTLQTTIEAEQQHHAAWQRLVELTTQQGAVAAHLDDLIQEWEDSMTAEEG